MGHRDKPCVAGTSKNDYRSVIDEPRQRIAGFKVLGVNGGVKRGHWAEQ